MIFARIRAFFRGRALDEDLDQAEPLILSQYGILAFLSDAEGQA